MLTGGLIVEGRKQEISDHVSADVSTQNTVSESPGCRRSGNVRLSEAVRGTYTRIEFYRS